MNAYKAAEELQTAFCNASPGEFFNVSSILGSDWARGGGFADRTEYLEEIKRAAEIKFGPLPFDPFFA